MTLNDGDDPMNSHGGSSNDNNGDNGDNDNDNDMNGNDSPLLLPEQEDSTIDGDGSFLATKDGSNPRARIDHDNTNNDTSIDEYELHDKRMGLDTDTDSDRVSQQRRAQHGIHQDGQCQNNNNNNNNDKDVSSSSAKVGGNELTDPAPHNTHNEHCDDDENDDMNDSNNDDHAESSTVPPSKRFRDAEWDGLVRSGSRIKALVNDAFLLAFARHDENNQNSQNNHEVDNVDLLCGSGDGAVHIETACGNSIASVDHESWRQTGSSHCAALAREKAATCMILEKKLEEERASVEALKAANDALREAASSSSERLERTVEALRIAGSNAANARADADAAEAYASSLATQLKTLRNTIDETKRASQSLAEEHQVIAEASRSLETKVLQRETEHVRFQHEIQALREACDVETKRVLACNSRIEELRLELEERNLELDSVRKEVGDYTAMEDARKARSERVETELRETKTMLVGAASAAAETEATMSSLRETIDRLKAENQKLHEGTENAQSRARKEQERLQAALAKVEKEAQDYRIERTSHENEMKQLRSEKQLAEKQVSQLKTRVIGLERKLKDTACVVSPSPTINIGNTNSGAGTTGRTVPFRIPPLTPGKEGYRPTRNNVGTFNRMAMTAKRTTAKATSNALDSPSSRSSAGGSIAHTTGTCCLCLNPASGMMKTCQCGNKACKKRAHSTCIASVAASMGGSHRGDGTLAASATRSVILCDRES